MASLQAYAIQVEFFDGKYRTLKGDDAIKFLESLGNFGWELVSVTSPSSHQIRGGVSDHEIFWFKRPKSE
jgi:hypothetical protein